MYQQGEHLKTVNNPGAWAGNQITIDGIYSAALDSGDAGPSRPGLDVLYGREDGDYHIRRGGHNVLQRLLDMGLTPGTKICIVRVAPLGGPVELSVRSSKVALGKGIASKVFVDVEKNS